MIWEKNIIVGTPFIDTGTKIYLILYTYTVLLIEMSFIWWQAEHRWRVTIILKGY